MIERPSIDNGKLEFFWKPYGLKPWELYEDIYFRPISELGDHHLGP